MKITLNHIFTVGQIIILLVIIIVIIAYILVYYFNFNPIPEVGPPLPTAIYDLFHIKPSLWECTLIMAIGMYYSLSYLTSLYMGLGELKTKE